MFFIGNIADFHIIQPLYTPYQFTTRKLNMAGLQLTPNEIVGYRIKPDWYNFKVVLVKKKGAASKDKGAEYEDVLGYCRSIEFAAKYIVDHATRMYGEEYQAASLSEKKTVADALALMEAIAKAKECALVAVKELDERIKALGLSRKELVVGLGEGGDDAPAAEKDAA